MNPKRMHVPPRRRRRGTTLIEVMIALFIATMAVAVFGTALPFAADWVSRSRQTDLATNGCEQQIELWRDAGYGSLPAIPAGSTSVSQFFTPPTALNHATGTIKFSRISDSLATTSADTGLIRLDATITWTGTGADGGTVTMTTIIGK